MCSESGSCCQKCRVNLFQVVFGDLHERSLTADNFLSHQIDVGDEGGVGAGPADLREALTVLTLEGIEVDFLNGNR